jgi:hypothetical protein
MLGEGVQVQWECKKKRGAGVVQAQSLGQKNDCSHTRHSMGLFVNQSVSSLCAIASGDRSNLRGLAVGWM